LPADELMTAVKHSGEAQLRLVLGTSMRVAPANKLPFEDVKTSNLNKVVIVNMQKTPYDSMADLRIFAKTDDFFRAVMKELKIDVKEYEVDDKILIQGLQDMIIDDS